MRRILVTGVLFTAALLFFSTQAGAAKSHAGAVKEKLKRISKPVGTLAMDGSRVAYMTTDRRVAVWNVATGATSVIKGTYPSKGGAFGSGVGTGEVAIAGKRVAVITRFVTGNSQQTQERLYTAALGGTARQLGKLTNHYTNPLDGMPEGGLSAGTWIAGAVGSGKTLAVSTWSSNDSVTAHERLSLVTPTGLHTIATGPGAIVAKSADDGHIAVFRSTAAWPADYVRPATATPTVGIYSSEGALLRELALDPDASDVALSGNKLVVLTQTIQAGTLVATLQVYDWTTGVLAHTWPVALGRTGGYGLVVHGRFAAVEGSARLRVVDLTSGKDLSFAPSSPAAIGARGLVYAVNRFKGVDKIVFVPTAKLLADLG
jgi:hypothetical protein